MTRIYDTHDNGDRAFRVRITEFTQNGQPMKHLTVRQIITQRSRPLFQMDSREVFIGMSPLNDMTRFSGGHGPNFDGNSILVTLEEPNTYMHIGTNILIFRSKARIIEYVSPVGNNDVPYPWAVDTQGNYYLVIEQVVMLSAPSLTRDIEQSSQTPTGGDPYTYYYHHAILSSFRAGTAIPVVDNFDDIESMMVGDEKFSMTYTPNPEANYDRMIGWDQGNISVLRTDESREILDLQGYTRLQEAFGRKRGFEAMEIMEERNR